MDFMRTIYHFNEGWSFRKPGEEAVLVTLPHTWNGLDGQDGGRGRHDRNGGKIESETM